MKNSNKQLLTPKYAMRKIKKVVVSCVIGAMLMTGMVPAAFAGNDSTSPMIVTTENTQGKPLWTTPDDGSVTVTPAVGTDYLSIVYYNREQKQCTLVIRKWDNQEWMMFQGSHDLIGVNVEPQSGKITIAPQGIKPGSLVEVIFEEGSSSATWERFNAKTPSSQQVPDIVQEEHTIVANEDGSVTIKPAKDDDGMLVSYTDEKIDSVLFVDIYRKGSEWVAFEPSVSTDMIFNKMTGELTIPAEKVKDESNVSVTFQSRTAAMSPDLTVQAKKNKTAPSPNPKQAYEAMAPDNLIEVGDLKQLTGPEKEQVRAAVAAKNPHASKVTVHEDGRVTLQYDGYERTLSAGQTVKAKPIVEKKKPEPRQTSRRSRAFYPRGVLPKKVDEKVETKSKKENTIEKKLYTDKAYIKGYPDGTFAPEQKVTRAEVTAIFMRLLKEKDDHLMARSEMKDIAEDAWYHNAVAYMTAKGIVSGYGNGEFRPDAKITRAEFVSMAARLDDIGKDEMKAFKDVDASHWAYQAINHAAAKGWMSGYGDQRFKPDAPITRAEVVSSINRMLHREANMTYIREHQNELAPITDVPKDHWAYTSIVVAMNDKAAVHKENITK